MGEPLLFDNLDTKLPSRSEAVVWAIPLEVSRARYAACEATLSADELARANRFVHADIRRRFVICRGALRCWLAGVTGMQPAELRFQYARSGKPHLANSTVMDLHFNVSHSGDWGVICLARQPVGIDIELIQTQVKLRTLATQLLASAERGKWERLELSEQERAIWQVWVCKEALLKAMGLGIADWLTKVCLPVPLPVEDAFAPQSLDAELLWALEDDGTCRRTHWIDTASWRLRLLTLIPDSFTALCVPSIIDHVRLVC